MKSLLRRRIPPRAAAAVAVLVLAATVVSGREKRDLAAEPAQPADRVAAVAADAAAALDLEKLKRPRSDDAIADLFAAPAAPATPPQVQPRAEPAPAAAAPPLPFRYLAKIIDGTEISVFLSHGDDHYSVKPGQVIDRRYRVERITDTAVTFRHLPTGTRQVLEVPALN